MRTLPADVTEPSDLRRAIEGADVVVNATSGHLPHGGIAEAALAAGADMVDLQFPAWDASALAPSAEAAQRCLVTQAGFHPGVPGALVRWAASKVDTLTSAWTAGLLRPPGGIPYTPAVDDLVESFRHYQAHVYEGGDWRRVRLVSPEAYPSVRFAFAFGRQRTSSMDLDELRSLPEAIPSLQRLGFSAAGFDPVSDLVVTSLIFAALPFAGPAGVSRLARLLCWSTSTFGRPPFGTVVQAEADGWRDGEPVRLRAALFHEDAYELTAIPAASMVEQILDRSAFRPGAHLMGLLVDPDRLLADAQEMGARVLRQEAVARPAVATGARRPRRSSS